MDLAQTEGIKIRKLDAAQRQLRTSIKMWFYEEDPVSTHSLAYAALTVIEDVIKARSPNRAGLLFDSPHITANERQSFIRVFRKSGNFFKHADRDPDDELRFSTDHTRIFLNFATHGLELLCEPLSDELLTFQAWSIFQRPEIRSKEGRAVFTDSFIDEYRAAALQMSKREFFEFYAEVLTKIREIRSKRHVDSSGSATPVSDLPRTVDTATAPGP